MVGDYAELLLGWSLLAEGSGPHDPVRFTQLVAGLMETGLDAAPAPAAAAPVEPSAAPEAPAAETTAVENEPVAESAAEAPAAEATTPENEPVADASEARTEESSAPA